MRVLVTRAEADALRTAASLATLGHEGVPAPVIVVAPRPLGSRSERPAALLATSHHAFAVALPPVLDRALPIFAVGERTADAARAAGFRDVRVGTGDGPGLAPLVILTLPRPGPLLYLAGRDRKPDLEAALSAAGYTVEAVDVYAAEAAPAWPEAAVTSLRSGTVAAALHYSHRSAESALALARRHDVLDPVLNLRHLCLSADAAEPLIAARATAVLVADRPDEASLLALLANL